MAPPLRPSTGLRQSLGVASVRTPIPYDKVLHDVAVTFRVIVRQLDRHHVADIRYRIRRHHIGYSQNLDIAHVVAITQVPNVCKVVPVQITCHDSKGTRHIMEYQVIGNGCTN